MADERGPWGIMAGPGGIRARDPDTFHLHTVLNSTNAKGDLGRSQILDAAVRHERNPSALLLVDDFQAAHSAVRPPKLDEAEGKDKDDTAAEDKGHFLPKLPVDKEDTHDDAVREGPLRKSVKERKIEYCFQDIEWWWFQNGGNQVQKSDSEGQPGA